MKISNENIFGLDKSIIASGYPMKLEIVEHDELLENSLKRAKKLGIAKSGSGHDNYLKGIIVQFDLKAPEYFWRQFDRYHFHDYVSSQSKMHCLLKMDIDSMCNKYVDARVISVLKELIDEYNSCDQDWKQHMFQKVISNCPMGFELTARITSNYLQEKSIYYQRKNHKLEEWKYYTNWLLTLPIFEEIVLGIEKP